MIAIATIEIPSGTSIISPLKWTVGRKMPWYLGFARYAEVFVRRMGILVLGPRDDFAIVVVWLSSPRLESCESS